MSTKITADNGATIEVGQLGITVVHPEGTASIWARLSQEQRAALAEAVSPAAAPYSQGREWTRADLPNIGVCQSNGLGYGSNDYAGADLVLDTVVDWLNAHYSKPERGVETGYALQVDALTLERDAAVARATLAEQDRENWRVTAINRATPAVSRANVEKAIGSRPVVRRFLDDVTMVSVSDAADAVCDLLGVEAEQDVDPVEELTDNLADILYRDELVTDQMRGVLERVVRAGMLLPEQEADR